MIKLIKYGLTGLVASSVDFGLFALLVNVVHWPWFIAACCSFVLATVAGYLLSIRMVFISGARFRKHEEIALVFLVSVIGLIVNQAALYILAHAGIALLLAKLGASAFVVAWNFTARYCFVFKSKRPALSD